MLKRFVCSKTYSVSFQSHSQTRFIFTILFPFCLYFINFDIKNLFISLTLLFFRLLVVKYFPSQNKTTTTLYKWAETSLSTGCLIFLQIDIITFEQNPFLENVVFSPRSGRIILSHKSSNPYDRPTIQQILDAAAETGLPHQFPKTVLQIEKVFGVMMAAAKIGCCSLMNITVTDFLLF